MHLFYQHKTMCKDALEYSSASFPLLNFWRCVMKKAAIGVTPLWDRDRDSYWMLPGYLEGLELAGLLPITLPLTEDAQDISQLVSLCDGFLFTGRQDVPTRLYSEKTWQACGEICEKRGTFEQRLFA